MKIIILALFFNILLTQNIKFKNSLTLGSPEEDKMEFIFTEPTDIQVDKNENIYIYNKNDQFIRRFDKNGKFLNKIGRVGKGPGEFVEIGTWFIEEDKIIIYDVMLFRLTIYSLDGKKYSLNNERHYGITNIIKINNEYILNTASNKSKYSNKELFFYNNNFEKISSIVNPIKDKEDYFTSYLQEGSKFILFEKDRIIIAPLYYSGFLYSLKNNESKWEIEQIHSDKLFKAYSYENIKTKDIPKLKKGYRLVSIMDKRIYLDVKCMSIGTIEYKNKYLIHFYFIYNTKKERKYYCDIFNKELEFVKTIEFDVEKSSYGLKMFTYQKDHLYWLDFEDDFPIIKKSKLEITGL